MIRPSLSTLYVGAESIVTIINSVSNSRDHTWPVRAERSSTSML